jgi:hypothetical protein
MSRYSLKDILKSKKPGDEWYTLAAPEEVSIWQLKSQWPKNLFKDKLVSPLSISVTSYEKFNVHREKYKAKNPLRLPCGVEVIGFLETKTNKKFQGKARIDSVSEVNIFLKELSEKTGLVTWYISNLHIYNANEGVETEFRVHNPDGHGPGFFLFRIWKGKESILYPDICIEAQKRYVGKFYSNLSHCTAVEQKDVVHGCALEKKITKKQIVRRSKKT